MRKTVESWGEVKSFPSQWVGERKIGEGGGGEERKIHLPALICLFAHVYFYFPTLHLL